VGRQAVERKQVLNSRQGRFHDDPDSEPTSYLAASIETAWLEVGARFGKVRPDPLAFRLFRVKLPAGELADLADPKVRERVGLSQNDLAADPAPAACRQAARKLRAEGRGQAGPMGLTYPSLRDRPKGLCAAIFLERVTKVGVEPADAEWRAYMEKLP